MFREHTQRTDVIQRGTKMVPFLRPIMRKKVRRFAIFCAGYPIEILFYRNIFFTGKS